MTSVEIFHSPWAWLIVGLVLIIGETLLPGVLLLWIGSGALAVGALLMLWPDILLPVQLVLMACFMFASIGLGIRLQHRRNDAKTINIGLAAYIGQEIIVTHAFQAGNGRIHLNDTSYSAQSTDQITAGAKVVITAYLDGRFTVKRLADATDD